MHGLAIGMPGGPELAVLLFVFVAVFGLGKWKSIASELPGAARIMGSGIRSFKKGLTEPPSDDEEPTPDAVDAPAVSATGDDSAAAPAAEEPAATADEAPTADAPGDTQPPAPSSEGS